MTLVPIAESKDILKWYEGLWNEIRGLVRPITNGSGIYDEKYMKIKFSSDDDLPLIKFLNLITWQ